VLPWLMLRSAVALLLFVEPIRFASEALTVLPTIAYRGPAAAIELLLHGALAALCVAAGLGLWNASPDSARLASVAIVAVVVRVLQSLYWSALPNNTRPGDEPLVAGVSIALGIIALLVVRRPQEGGASP
jgi:hypothetical protein